MTQKTDGQISVMEAQIALPRENGELVFQAPWEARAFGLAVALNEKESYEWREFSAELAAKIAAAEQNNDPSSYYARWGCIARRIGHCAGPNQSGTTRRQNSGIRRWHVRRSRSSPRSRALVDRTAAYGASSKNCAKPNAATPTSNVSKDDFADVPGVFFLRNKIQPKDVISLLNQTPLPTQ